MRTRAIGVSLLVLLLAACAGPAPRSADEAPVAEPVQRGEDADLMLHLMAGELALKERDPERALQEYRQALALSNSPKVAERTARIALFLGRDDVALEAAEKWRQWAPEDPQALRVIGQLQLEQGELDEAVATFQGFVEAADSPAQAFEQLVGGLRQQGDQEAALTAIRRLAEHYPEIPQAQLALAQLALLDDQYQLVAESVERALALRPGWRDAYLLLAEAQRRAGDETAALDTLREALEAGPEDFELRLQYARALLGAGFADEALAEFRRLVQDRPADSRALYAAALLSLEQGEYQQARDYLLRLVNLGENVDAAYYYLGRIAESEDDVPGALRWYNRVEAGDYLERARLRVPVLLAEQGQVAQARQVLHALRGEIPDLAVQTYLAESRILRDAGRVDEARQVLTEALQEYPEHPDLLYNRALMAAGQGDVENAERDLRQVLEQAPDNALALNALGYTLVDMTDRIEEGFRLISRAYEGGADDPAIIDSMGWAHYRMGKLEEALDYLSRAYQLSPNDEIAAHLGEVLWKLGRHDEARAVWREALERAPESAIIKQTMERLTQ